MKKVLALILFVTLLASLTSVAFAADVQKSKLQVVLERGYLIVGTGSTNVPWHSINANGEYEGFDIEMGRILATGLFGDPSKVQFVEQASDQRIPNTLADDGDPLDVLVVTPYPVTPGSVIRARPVGILNMTDDGGGDAKVIAVPHDKLSQLYVDVKEYTDLPPLLLEQIKHFFENYKDLEKGKWVKIDGWGNADAARAEILKSVAAYKG